MPVYIKANKAVRFSGVPVEEGKFSLTLELLQIIQRNYVIVMEEERFRCVF